MRIYDYDVESYEFKRDLWRSMRNHWPAEYRPNVFMKYVPRNDSVEFTVYFVADGRELRLDWEIALLPLSEEDDLVDAIVLLMFERVQKDIEEGVA